MKKLILVCVIAGFASGCGSCKRGIANMTGWSTVCVAGVTYIQFPSGVTVQRDINDKLVPCR